MTRREVVALTCVAVVIAAVWIWRVQTSERGDRMAEASASYYPDDAIAYGWLTLAPAGDQRENMEDFRGWLHEFWEMGGWMSDSETSRVDTDRGGLPDIGTWIGDDHSAALFDLGDGEMGMVAAFGVEDQGAADEFLARWMERQEAEGAGSLERYEADGDVIWQLDGHGWAEERAFARTGDLLIIATGRDLLERVLDLINGEPGPSLADDPQFTEARSALPARRFASLYLDLGWISGFMDDPEAECQEPGFETPDWLMASAGWVEGGLVLDVVAPGMAGRRMDGSSAATAEVVPAGAFGFLSVRFESGMEDRREAPGECGMPDGWALGDLFDLPYGDEEELLEDGANPAGVLDLALEALDLGMGIDFEADIFDHLDGDLVLAVWGSEGEGLPVEGVVALSYRPLSRDGLEETLDEVTGFATPIGGFLEQIEVGAANPARVMDFGESFAFGYVLNDGFLMVGTEEGLETSVAVQNGTMDGIADSEKYRRVTGHIPYDPKLLAYLDIGRLVEEMGPAMLDTDSDLNGALSDWGALAFGVGSDRDYTRATLVLSLLPAD